MRIYPLADGEPAGEKVVFRFIAFVFIACGCAACVGAGIGAGAGGGAGFGRVEASSATVHVSHVGGRYCCEILGPVRTPA